MFKNGIKVISFYLENNACVTQSKIFSRTNTLNSMIRTVTVEEDALKQTETDAKEEKLSVQSPYLIGNHYVWNKVSSKYSSSLYFNLSALCIS